MLFVLEVFNLYTSNCAMGLPGGSVVKKLSANAGDVGSVLGLGRSPPVGNGNSLQESCLEDPMDGGALRTIGLQRVGHNRATEKQIT